MLRHLGDGTTYVAPCHGHLHGFVVMGSTGFGTYRLKTWRTLMGPGSIRKPLSSAKVTILQGDLLSAHDNGIIEIDPSPTK